MERPKRSILILVLFFLLASPSALYSQANFVRDDNFDYHGLHALSISDDQVNPTVTIATDFDWGLFKLYVRTGQEVNDNWHVNRVIVDMNDDGIPEANIGPYSEGIASYQFPTPPSGTSVTYHPRVDIEYKTSLTGGSAPYNKTVYGTITILPHVRAWADGFGNSVVQFSDEDAEDKIPVLIVEGIDAGNLTFADTYYQLTIGSSISSKAAANMRCSS